MSGARILASLAAALLVVACVLLARPAARVSLQERFEVVGRGRQGQLLVAPVVGARRVGGRGQGLRLLAGGGGLARQRAVQQLVVEPERECDKAWNPEGTPNGCGPTRPAVDYGADINLTEETQWMYDNSGAGLECCPCLGKGVDRCVAQSPASVQRRLPHPRIFCTKVKFRGGWRNGTRSAPGKYLSRQQCSGTLS